MSSSKETRFYGYLAEFETVNGLVDACAAIRDAGYTRWDAHTPFPVHGLDGAMGMRTTKLPWVVFFSGLTGAGLGLLLQYWTSAVDYPLIISGKPLFSWQAFIPVTFELGVLFAAAGAVLSILHFSKLPRYHHPLFSSTRFERATQDRFFIAIEAEDPKYDSEATRRLLEGAGATHIELVEDRDA